MNWTDFDWKTYILVRGFFSQKGCSTTHAPNCPPCMSSLLPCQSFTMWGKLFSASAFSSQRRLSLIPSFLRVLQLISTPGGGTAASASAASRSFWPAMRACNPASSTVRSGGPSPGRSSFLAFSSFSSLLASAFFLAISSSSGLCASAFFLVISSSRLFASAVFLAISSSSSFSASAFFLAISSSSASAFFLEISSSSFFASAFFLAISSSSSFFASASFLAIYFEARDTTGAFDSSTNGFSGFSKGEDWRNLCKGGCRTRTVQTSPVYIAIGSKQAARSKTQRKSNSRQLQLCEQT